MTANARIVVLYAHAAPHRSRVNRQLADAARLLPEVYVHDLYETYPDFHIDVAREQALIAQAELLVFLHPLLWYSMPSLLKEWVDVVLEPGWAYGKHGNALGGKGYWLAVTTGSPADTFQPGGAHGRPLSDFLAPFEQTAALCGMHWLPPLVLHGAHHPDPAIIEAHVAAFRHGLERHLQAPAIGAASVELRPQFTLTGKTTDHGK